MNESLYTTIHDFWDSDHWSVKRLEVSKEDSAQEIWRKTVPWDCEKGLSVSVVSGTGLGVGGGAVALEPGISSVELVGFTLNVFERIGAKRLASPDWACGIYEASKETCKYFSHANRSGGGEEGSAGCCPWETLECGILTTKMVRSFSSRYYNSFDRAINPNKWPAHQRRHDLLPLGHLIMPKTRQLRLLHRAVLVSQDRCRV